MTTVTICVLATVIASSNALLGWLNQSPPPQEYIHHHHHHHEVVHKSSPSYHSQELVKVVHRPVEIHPQHVKVYEVIHDGSLGYGIEHENGLAVQPIVNKNFIHSQHVHHYHQIAPASAHGWSGWD